MSDFVTNDLLYTITATLQSQAAGGGDSKMLQSIGIAVWAVCIGAGLGSILFGFIKGLKMKKSQQDKAGPEGGKASNNQIKISFIVGIVLICLPLLLAGLSELLMMIPAIKDAANGDGPMKVLFDALSTLAVWNVA